MLTKKYATYMCNFIHVLHFHVHTTFNETHPHLQLVGNEKHLQMQMHNMVRHTVIDLRYILRGLNNIII